MLTSYFPEFVSTKMWHGNFRSMNPPMLSIYYVILGRYLLTQLGLDIEIAVNTIVGGAVTYKEDTAHISNLNHSYLKLYDGSILYIYIYTYKYIYKMNKINI